MILATCSLIPYIIMEDCFFFHMFANGNDSRNFIISESDFYAAFNLVGVCAANTNAKVVSFSIEETHPHVLLYGAESDCTEFKTMYERSVIQHILSTRGSLDNVRFNCELYAVTGNDYLKNVAVYTIVQPTKDGKKIMPYDYLWGTASMYFRDKRHIPIWQVNYDGTVSDPVPMGTLSCRQRRLLTASRKTVPGNWLTCNGFILPSNYIDVERFEAVYATPNCFRVFMGNSKRHDEETVISKMLKVQGIDLEDLEARRISEEVCYSLFEKRTARWLDNDQRLKLAIELRRRYKLSVRQTAILARLPEKEIRAHLK